MQQNQPVWWKAEKYDIDLTAASTLVLTVTAFHLLRPWFWHIIDNP